MKRNFLLKVTRSMALKALVRTKPNAPPVRTVNRTPLRVNPVRKSSTF